MAFGFPAFDEPAAIAVGRFVVQVGLHWAGDDGTRPEFLDRLRAEIQAVVATGETDTSYRGYGR